MRSKDGRARAIAAQAIKQTGQQGLLGAKGDMGVQGPAGSQGPAGVQGITGPKGDTGAQGPAGVQGITGLRGESGQSTNDAIQYGITAPTDGTYEIGNIVINSFPAPLDYIGWVCVGAGTPGTWKGYGLIQA